jgi:Ca2+/Na+ antiporter
MVARFSNSASEAIPATELSLRDRESGQSLCKRSRREAGAKIGRGLQDLLGWWLAVLLVLAPWAYGTTFDETKMWLAEALCALGPLFIISLMVRRRWPRVNWLSILLSFAILGYGWWMTWNAKLFYDTALFYFHYGSPPVPALPGTVDQKTSATQMLLITGFFFAFWVAADLSARERWRSRFWLVLSLTGVSIVILGLAQRLTNAPGIFWRIDLECGPSFFATYRYHANAGAFINLIFPLVVARCVTAFRRKSEELARPFWFLAMIAVLVSAFVNVSRAASVITLCVFILFSAHQLYEVCRTRRKQSRVLIAILGVLAVVAVGALVWVVGFGQAYQRWVDPRWGNMANDSRFAAYDAIEHGLLPAAGWWGLGPATFHLTFPFFTIGYGQRLLGYWEYGHEDYLQTLVEWGFCGAGLWILFFGNNILRSGWAFLRRQGSWDSGTRAFAVACLLSVGSVLVHAAIDFPMQIASLQLYTCVIVALLAALPHVDSQRIRRFRAEDRSTSGSALSSATERMV